MKLLLTLHAETYLSAIEFLDQHTWRIVKPSLYSDTWAASGQEISLSVIKQYIPRFESIYIEEGLSLESGALFQHALLNLSVSEYYLCDFDSLENIQNSIDGAYFVDKNHANAKYAEHKINAIFINTLSKAIKQQVISSRTAQYKANYRGTDYTQLEKLKKGWHKQLQNYFVLLPTLAGLHWIVKAERSILAHDPRTVSRIYVQYRKDDIDFSLYYPTAFTEEYYQERNDTIEYLRNNKHVVDFYEASVKEVKPTGAIVLSFLQAKMFYMYHFSIEYTTKIAKRLHQAGLISDPMTSSSYIPIEISIALIQSLNERYGEEYVLQHQRPSKEEYAGTTAIFPTHFEEAYYPENIDTTPEFMRINFDNPQMKNDAFTMYFFIYSVTEWIQMKNAIYDSSALQLSVGNKKVKGDAKSLTETFDAETGKWVAQKSWKSINQNLQRAISSASGEPSDEDMVVVLPKCKFGEVLDPINIKYINTTPKRPPRYGVGRFNTTVLGAKGIGTAESFHVIQNNLVNGGLVAISKDMMHPQEIAMETIEWCEQYCPGLLDEKTTIEYWEQLDKIRFDQEDPERLIKEYQFLVDEILDAAGYEENAGQISDAQVKLAKAIARQKGIRIDNPESFFSNHEKVRYFLDIHSIDEVKEEDKLFKCPICRQGYVYEREFVNTDSNDTLIYYACEHPDCFRIYDNKVDEFFVAKKMDLNKAERIEALRNIASKQHLKNKGYLFSGFIGKNEKPYEAKVCFEGFVNQNNKTSYKLKLEF
jgi:DNA topoisomerase IA